MATASIFSHASYRAIRPGTSTIEVRTAAAAFGGEVARTHLVVRVDSVELTLQPERVWLEPADVFDFQVSIKAEFPDSIRVLQPDKGHAEIRHHDGAQPTVRYTAPASPNFGQPDNTIFVSHTIAPAFSQALVGFADLQMAPKSGCLEPGGSTFIERTFEGSLFKEVVGDPVFVWDTGGRGSWVDASCPTRPSSTSSTRSTSPSVGRDQDREGPSVIAGTFDVTLERTMIGHKE